MDLTISQWLIEKINEYTVSEYENRTYDFISVLHAATLNVGYRKRLIDFINNNNMKFTNGGGNSHEDNDLDRLFSYYNNSKIALGVSNLGVKEDFQTMKGFRDFIAPFFDVPIVYDNFELVKNAYGNIMPYYEYGSFKNLIELANELKENSLLRTNYVNQQKEFAINNTIDKQLHNVIQ